jgi:hypothetical protein
VAACLQIAFSLLSFDVAISFVKILDQREVSRAAMMIVAVMVVAMIKLMQSVPCMQSCLYHHWTTRL